MHLRSVWPLAFYVVKVVKVKMVIFDFGNAVIAHYYNK